jgi:hypothetical protein
MAQGAGERSQIERAGSRAVKRERNAYAPAVCGSVMAREMKRCHNLMFGLSTDFM